VRCVLARRSACSCALSLCLMRNLWRKTNTISCNSKPTRSINLWKFFNSSLPSQIYVSSRAILILCPAHFWGTAEIFVIKHGSSDMIRLQNKKMKEQWSDERKSTYSAEHFARITSYLTPLILLFVFQPSSCY
jgi:hypothetical protein